MWNTGNRLLADESDDDPEGLEKDERRDMELLHRIANALVEFYGLGEVTWLFWFFKCAILYGKRRA